MCYDNSKLSFILWKIFFLIFLSFLITDKAHASNSVPVCDESNPITVSITKSDQPLMYGDVWSFYEHSSSGERECRLSDNSKFRDSSGWTFECNGHLVMPGTKCEQGGEEAPKNPKQPPEPLNNCVINVRFYNTHNGTSRNETFTDAGHFRRAVIQHFSGHGYPVDLPDQSGNYRKPFVYKSAIDEIIQSANKIRKCGDRWWGYNDVTIWGHVWNNPRTSFGRIAFEMSYKEKEEKEEQPKDPKDNEPPKNPKQPDTPQASEPENPKQDDDGNDSPKDPKQPDSGGNGNDDGSPPKSPKDNTGNNDGSNGNSNGGNGNGDGSGSGDEWGNVSPIGMPDVPKNSKSGRWGADFFLKSSASATCPADKVFTVFGKQISFSWQPFCDLMITIRPFVIALSMFLAGMMVFKSLRAK